jgi:hypothetical protein
MRTAARSAGYAALLVAAFAAAWVAGALAQPAPAPAAAPPTATHAAPVTPDLARAEPVAPPPPVHAAPITPDPAPSRVAEVDGYQVRLDGDLTVGAPAQVFVTVSRGGAPVADLEPLGDAFGRLDAVRAGDLVPAHVHPDATPPAPTDRAGPGIAFTVEVPGGGAYRLVLGFRHAGAVHTAVFTLPAG